MSSFVPLTTGMKATSNWSAELTARPREEGEGARPRGERPRRPAPKPVEEPAVVVEAATELPAAEAEIHQRVAELEQADRDRRQEHARAMQELTARQRALAEAEERLDAVAAQLEAERAALLAETRAGVAALIGAAAERIAGEALQWDPALLDALCDAGIAALGAEHLVISVSPADVERVKDRLEARGIHVRADDTVDAGCVHEGPAGRIDARASTAIAAVNAVLDQWARQ